MSLNFIQSYITNKSGHGQSGQFYATLDTIIVTQSGPETHIALSINPVIHFFSSPLQITEPPPRGEGFSDLVILEQIRRVNIYIEG